MNKLNKNMSTRFTNIGENQMKPTHILFLILALVLSACSGQATPAPALTSSDSYVSPNLDTTFEGALPVRNQLTLGTLELDGTPNAITAEQAQTLLPLWQALLDGTVGVIDTDHSPHSREEKFNDNIWKVTPGFVGVETKVPLMLTQVNADMAANGLPLHLVFARNEAGYALNVYDCSDTELCRLTRDVPLNFEELTATLETLRQQALVLAGQAQKNPAPCTGAGFRLNTDAGQYLKV